MKYNSHLEKEYNKYYDTHFGVPSIPREDSKITTLVNLVGSNKTVLDVGCSTGYLCHFLSKQGNRVVGIDFIKSAVDTAVKNGLDCHHCNIENEDIPPKTGELFDVIVLSEIIEHFIDPLQVVNKLTQHLNKNGVIIISTPNIAYVQYRFELLFGNLPDFCEFRNKFFERPYNFQHKSFFTHKILVDTLSMANLNVIKKTSHVAYKNKFERIFNIFEFVFPKLFIKNIVFVCEINI